MILAIPMALEPFLPRHSLLRLISVAITAVVFVLTRGQSPWHELVFSLGFGHYALSLIYARKQMVRVVLGQPHTLLPCLILLVGVWVLYRNDVSLLLYFGVHHIFNEVYLLERGVGLKDSAEVRAFRVGSLALHFLLYCALFRHYPDLDFVPDTLVFAGLAVAYPVFFALLYRLRGVLTPGACIDLCLFEVLGLFLLIATSVLNKHVWFLQVVFYHFVFWSLYPLPKMAAQGRREVKRYIFLNIALTGTFLFLILLAISRWGATLGMVEAHFRLWSYIHITFSFALSSAHPSWITRWFQPRPKNIDPS